MDPETEQVEENAIDETLESDLVDAPDQVVDAGDGGTESSDSAAWQEELKKAGFQSFDDVDKAVRALVEANRQREEQAKYYADQLRFYQSQQSQTRQADPQPEPASTPGDPLTEIIKDWTDPSWASKYIEVDENGNRVISANADEQTKSKIQDIDRRLRQWQELVNDPRQFAQAIDARVERMIQEKFEDGFTKKQQAISEEQYIKNFVDQNSSWLYAKDPATGQYLRDHVSGRLVYSSLGEKFQDQVDRLGQSGVSSVAKQIEIASEIVRPGTLAGQQQPERQPTPQEMIQQRRAAMRGVTTNKAKGTRQRSFNGVTPGTPGGETGENTMSWGELTLAQLKQGG